jgi:cyclic pyranopterin phosphate synthase
MTAAPLVDGFGRTVRDLRISVTDRCNFRCTYCMPAEGMTWLPREDLLTFEEIERVARVCVNRFGFTGIRLTGGEPTVRAHLPVLVQRLAVLGVDLAMTTNGSTMRLVADDLKAAGLHRLNISCDSLDRDRFFQMTRRDDLPKVLDGIAAAKQAGFAPIKINVVLMRGQNDDEIVDFARFGREQGVGVRFIEFMPLDADDAWSRETVVPSSEVIERINAVYPLVRLRHGAEPAARWGFADGVGDVGVIASVTEPFCGDCDRVRITAEGQFRTCLFSTDEFDLRAIIRYGGTDDQLAAEVQRAVGLKWAGHQIGNVNFTRPKRSMSQIGG